MELLSRDLLEKYKKIKENLANFRAYDFDFFKDYYSGNFLLQEHDSKDSIYSLYSSLFKAFAAGRGRYFHQYKHDNDYSWSGVIPCEMYTKIAPHCKMISEDEEHLVVEFGKVPKVSLGYVQVQSLFLDYQIGNLRKTDKTLPFFIDENNENVCLPIYKSESGEEYIIEKDTEEELTFDMEKISLDDFKDEKAHIVKLEPLLWDVDLESGIAVARNTVCLTNGFDDYRTSKLRNYLNSREFLSALGVAGEYVQETEKSKKNNNPFKKEKKAVGLKEVITQVLHGGSRVPYLVGHPGVGKTAIVKSINEDYLAINISTFTPDAFTGKTAIIPGRQITQEENGMKIVTQEGGYTTTFEPDWHKKLVKLSSKVKEKGKRGLFFLDEFDKLTPNMQVFINGIVESPRTLAGWEIPENIDIVLAGNTEEYSDASFKISGEVASRLTKIEATPDVNQWLNYANQNHVDRLVRAFIFSNPTYLVKDAQTSLGEYDHEKSLTPRSWDQKIGKELEAARELGTYPLLEYYMQDKDRELFSKFIDVYYDLPVEDILSGNYQADSILTTSEQAVIINNLVATSYSEEEVTNALRFVLRTNNPELKSLYERQWLKINSSREEQQRYRLSLEDAKEEVDSHYGRK